MVLALAGVLLLVPRVAERVEARLSGLARLGPRSRGTGFWSGVGVGAALGFVYVPCAGPILRRSSRWPPPRGRRSGS